MEIWKSIPSWETSYEVSNLGRVRSLDRIIPVRCMGRKSYHSNRKGKILRPGRNTKQGHVTVSLGRRNSVNVHRLVMLAFVGPCPSGLEVLHIDGDASNNSLENLRYGTRSENNLDASRHNKRRLSRQAVEYIKNHKEISGYKLAKKFSVSQSLISAVRSGKLRKHA